jgi:hypothetical protein
MALGVYFSSDNLLEVTGLKNAASGNFVNNATVTANIVDSDGNAVTNATNISLSYISGSNGNYRGTIPDTADIDRSAEYVAQITADGGAGLKAYWEIDLQSQVRYN